jgi:hypothetical protein
MASRTALRASYLLAGEIGPHFHRLCAECLAIAHATTADAPQTAASVALSSSPHAGTDSAALRAAKGAGRDRFTVALT